MLLDTNDKQGFWASKRRNLLLTKVSIMKKWIFLLIFILLINHNLSFGEEKYYDKYLKMEEKYFNLLIKPYENDKTALLKLLIMDDCRMTCYLDFKDKVHTVGNDIITNLENLKTEPDNLNYSYALKTYELYKFLCNEYSQYFPKPKQLDLKDKEIKVPDEDFDKLDEAIITNIILLNSSLK